MLILSFFTLSLAITTLPESSSIEKVNAAKVDQGKLVKLTTKKNSVSSRYETNEHGIFYIKGKAIKNVKLTVKGANFKTLKKSVKKGKHFKVQVQLDDSKKKINLKLTATSGNKHSSKKINIYNRSDSYLSAIASSKASSSASVAAEESASSSAEESSEAASSSLAAAESASAAQSSSAAKAQNEAAEQSSKAASAASSSSAAATSSAAAASSTAAAQANNSNSNGGDDLYTGTQGQIIGNSRSHIYHVPGQAGYHMNSANAVYFANEQDAQANGYRKALR
ncbi:hypothetical protein FD20_GL000203 [Liquorilactobacillus uvarum DSM 19971]|uniref:DNA-entry nuclease n=2 Tax=Liquorilactobacillus uvarum TaxID=303240 RepID=A0A0R1QD93_9LACO|nr:hypothetical protein FD20_GL000203 [Liquorilactobacillus uvarum DSM 19971]